LIVPCLHFSRISARYDLKQNRLSLLAQRLQAIEEKKSLYLK